jgi:tetratricopeptide (TPR) repeat protein
MSGDKQVESADVDSVALSALDHYDLGRVQLRRGRFREAAREFQLVLDERPGDFWPNFYHGLCAYRLGQLNDAFAAFRTCIALAPRSAECYYNRARVAESLLRLDQAARDYSRAVELDPGLSRAFHNRGILAYKNGRHHDAIADFVQALRTTSDPHERGLIHYNLSLAHLDAGDYKRARDSAQKALEGGHDDARALRDGLVHQSQE